MSERFILPLRKYTVLFDNDEVLTFTADTMDYSPEAHTYRFFNTGNLIRIVGADGVEQIVVTPVDDA